MNETTTHISRMGRPKVMTQRIQTSINLGPEQIEILENLKDGITSKGEIIRYLIDLSVIDKKELRLFKENLELKSKIKELNKELSRLNKEISRKPKNEIPEIDKDYLEQLRKNFKNYLESTPSARDNEDLQLNNLRMRAKDLGIPVRTLWKMVK